MKFHEKIIKIHMNIPLTLYPGSGRRDISDIPPGHPHKPKWLSYADVTSGKLIVSRRIVVRQAAGRKIVVESSSQHDEKHVALAPLSGIRVGKRRRIQD
jgi:hypothetical protein